MVFFPLRAVLPVLTKAFIVNGQVRAVLLYLLDQSKASANSQSQIGGMILKMPGSGFFVPPVELAPLPPPAYVSRKHRGQSPFPEGTQGSRTYRPKKSLTIFAAIASLSLTGKP